MSNSFPTVEVLAKYPMPTIVLLNNNVFLLFASFESFLFISNHHQTISNNKEIFYMQLLSLLQSYILPLNHINSHQSTLAPFPSKLKAQHTDSSKINDTPVCRIAAFVILYTMVLISNIIDLFCVQCQSIHYVYNHYNQKKQRANFRCLAVYICTSIPFKPEHLISNWNSFYCKFLYTSHASFLLAGISSRPALSFRLQSPKAPPAATWDAASTWRDRYMPWM